MVAIDYVGITSLDNVKMCTLGVELYHCVLQTSIRNLIHVADWIPMH
jgi:hypothetical protein